ncbi:hypothetical protein [Alloactinosynnema sp. L-07]|uniref:hypothetical protein n=1 Tax=Alloactinosynnema sp. L-07 TaxID=1653480 RepID=UPI00065F065C|nr:hypothetical protein [Alloactinosynnema sp. L-07]CRK60233.1 hypothetical protein [Alloactinosynnema sp. L-07]
MTGPQQPYGGPPQGYGQQPYGQQPYGQPPFGPQQPPPRKSRAWVIASGLIAVLLVAGGGVLFWMDRQAKVKEAERLLAELSAGPEPTRTVDPSAPPTTTKPPLAADKVEQARAHAEKFVATINTRDEAAAIALTCRKTIAGGVYGIGSKTASAKVVGEPRIVDADRAVFDIEVSPGQVLPIEVYAKPEWCVFY